MENVLIDFNGSVYYIERIVGMYGSKLFVKINGEDRMTYDLNEPFKVEKLPRGAKKFK